MFISSSQIERAVEEVLPSFLTEPFPVAGYVNNVTARLKADPDAKERVAKEAELILAGDDRFFMDDEMAYPKAAFFRNTKLRIIPGRAELEQNLLLPGARFEPFCSQELFPDEYTVTADGKPCKVLTTKMRYADLAPASILLGKSGLLDYLCAESDANYRILRSSRNVEREMMEITAYDMTGFYREHQFQQGDAIIMTVIDWENAEFDLAYEKAADAPGKEKRERYIQQLEHALLAVCDDKRDPIDIPQQISFAFLKAFRQNEDLRFTPDFSLDEYHHHMLEIAIRHDGPDWTLVSADDVSEPGMAPVEPAHNDTEQEHHHHHHHDADCHCGEKEAEKVEAAETDIKPDQFSASSGTLDSLDAILVERNAPYDPVEVHAFVLDAIANGMENFADFRDRIYSLLGITFADEAQEAAFLNYLEDDWEISTEYFNPTFEGEKEPYRRRLLDLCEQRVDCSLRLLQHFKNDVPRNLAHPLAAFHRNVSDTLSLLSVEGPLPEEDEELDQLEMRIDDLEGAWEELSDRISDALGE